MVKLFFSYSHKDEHFRDELEVHLSMLKRQGILESWHDRRIGAGSEVDSEIYQELETSQIILLLVSPYFLASDYCYNREMTKAMEMHKSKQACVIPVILNPCDWPSAPFGKLMAVPTDGRPITKYPNHHDAYLEITTAIREATSRFSRPPQNGAAPEPLENAGSSPTTTTSQPRSSNLRVKKEFTQQQLDEFMDDSFEYLSKFFEGSLEELEKRNSEVSTRFRRVDANHFTAIIYKNGETEADCTISQGNLFGGIAYSQGTNINDHSFNETLSCESDGHSLFLKPMGLAFAMFGASEYPADKDNLLSQEGAAEYYWQILIQPLQ